MSREHELQLDRVRIGLLKASRTTTLGPSVIAAWERLGVPESSVKHVRLTLLEFAEKVRGNIKQQIAPPGAADYPQVLSELLELSKALAIAPTDVLPAIVRALLQRTVGLGTAAMTCSLQDAGLEIVPRDALAAIRILGREDAPQLSDVTALRWGGTEDWRLFADLLLLELGYPPLDPHDWADSLWSSPGLVDPALSPVHRWVAFRRAINLVKAGHLDAAWEQVQKFGAPSKPTSPVELEIVNLRAYLLLVTPADKEDDSELLDEAIALLTTISQSPVAARNLRLLRGRKETPPRDRPRIENPYLVLGVDHQDPEWKNAFRSILTSNVADINEKSDATRARDRILAFGRGLPDTLGDLYALPLDGLFTAPGTAARETGEDVGVGAPFQTEEELLAAAGPTAVEALKVAALSGLLEYTEQEQKAL